MVREARNYRRTRSRSKTEAKEDVDIGRVERGVNGRDIVVLHKQPPAQANGFAEPAGAGNVRSEPPQSPNLPLGLESGHAWGGPGRERLSVDGSQSPTTNMGSGFHRDITFADEVNQENSNDATSRLPVRLPAEQHIAFLENQRNPKDKGTLRIPGPRDFDRGVMPETVTEDETEEGLARKITSPTESSVAREAHERLHEIVDGTSSFNADDHPVRRNITIDEPTSPRTQPKTSPFNLKLRKGGHLRTPSFGMAISAARSRAATFSSAKTSQSRDPMPYLSWTPTIGRNSAFIDLSEEQREELGGIEYRALKTLAVILVGKVEEAYLYNRVLMYDASVLHIVPRPRCGVLCPIDHDRRCLRLRC